MFGTREKRYSFDQLSFFFGFVREERHHFSAPDLRLLLDGFCLLFARNLTALSLADTESLIRRIAQLEEDLFPRPTEKPAPQAEPLSAFELVSVPGRIREEMRRGAKRALLEGLVSSFERDIERSSGKITLSQSFQLHCEAEKLREEFTEVAR